MTKLCKDCRYYIYDADYHEYPLCNRPAYNLGKSLITGEFQHIEVECRDERKDNKDSCGTEGMYFEPFLWYKIKNYFTGNDLWLT